MRLPLRADVEDDRKQRVRNALLLLTPWVRLRLQIAVASHDMGDYFDTVDALLGDGRSLGKALGSGEHISNAMRKLVRHALISGYEDGLLLQDRPTNRRFDNLADVWADDRAAEVAAMMRATTKRFLKDNPDNAFALSEARADRAVNNEAASNYFNGLLYSLRGTPYMKAWITTSKNPCEICLENEDVGEIPNDEQFPSGHFAPLAHLNCQCEMAVYRL